MKVKGRKRPDGKPHHQAHQKPGRNSPEQAPAAARLPQPFGQGNPRQQNGPHRDKGKLEGSPAYLPRPGKAQNQRGKSQGPGGPVGPVQKKRPHQAGGHDQSTQGGRAARGQNRIGQAGKKSAKSGQLRHREPKRQGGPGGQGEPEGQIARAPDQAQVQPAYGQKVGHPGRGEIASHLWQKRGPPAQGQGPQKLFGRALRKALKQIAGPLPQKRGDFFPGEKPAGAKLGKPGFLARVGAGEDALFGHEATIVKAAGVGEIHKGL